MTFKLHGHGVVCFLLIDSDTTGQAKRALFLLICHESWEQQIGCLNPHVPDEVLNAGYLQAGQSVDVWGQAAVSAYCMSNRLILRCSLQLPFPGQCQ